MGQIVLPVRFHINSIFFSIYLLIFLPSFSALSSGQRPDILHQGPLWPYHYIRSIRQAVPSAPGASWSSHANFFLMSLSSMSSITVADWLLVWNMTSHRCCSQPLSAIGTWGQISKVILYMVMYSQCTLTQFLPYTLLPCVPIWGDLPLWIYFLGCLGTMFCSWSWSFHNARRVLAKVQHTETWNGMMEINGINESQSQKASMNA